ncbi:MAG: uroporphyrinogen-III synthase [Pirellulales bacterium]|nr:uroporphyrinogen-III synthase [Pirellulales bacterium]
MSPEYDPKSGRLYLASGSPESIAAMPLWRGENLDQVQLLIVSANLAERALPQVSDAVPVVCLPPCGSAATESAADLARRALLDGRTVVWLNPADPLHKRSLDGPGGPAADLRRWCGERAIATVAFDEPDSPRKLAGQWILLARARHQAADTVVRFGRLGAVVVSQPAIAIGPPSDPAALDAALARLDSYDWLVFSSANGVRFFLERLWNQSGDLRRLGRVKLAAIGPGTDEALGAYRLRADVVPGEYRAESLADALLPEARGKRCLLVRASRGREVLAERLSAGGATVEQVVAYDSTDVEPDAARLGLVSHLLDEGRIDWLPVTSSSIARSVAKIFGRRLAKTRLASISPITSEVLRELGHEPTVEAAHYTIDGIVEAMCGYVSSRHVDQDK